MKGAYYSVLFFCHDDNGIVVLNDNNGVADKIQDNNDYNGNVDNAVVYYDSDEAF